MDGIYIWKMAFQLKRDIDKRGLSHISCKYFVSTLSLKKIILPSVVVLNCTMNKYVVKTIKVKCFSGILLWRHSHWSQTPTPELVNSPNQNFMQYYSSSWTWLCLRITWRASGLIPQPPTQKFWFSSFGVGSKNVLF